MKLRRVTMVGGVAAGVAAVTLLVGLVTNVASQEQRWPGVLADVQRHPWISLGVLAVATMVLSGVLAALSDRTDAERKKPAEATPQEPGPASAEVMSTLPRDVSAFTNREAQIMSLVNHVSEFATTRRVLPVHTIDGMAGVGKTAFAIHVGHLLAPRFPDGQYFLNLNGYTPGRAPVGVSEALASLLLADGVPPQKIPVGDDPWAVNEARTALWRSRVANKRLLVILDNAANYEQVEPLLPGDGGSLVLITSRRRLAAPEAVTVEMEALPAHDAADLFVRLAGRGSADDRSVADLVQMSGYLPLAISLLAARLRHHPTWTIDDVKARLARAHDSLSEMRAGERAVAAAFDLSYQDLPADRQRFFRHISVFPGATFDEFSTAALGNTTTEAARLHLEALYEDHLLDENADSRYRMHDLVRAYGRRLAAEDAPGDGAPIDRLGEYFLAAIAAANRFIKRSHGVVEQTTAQSRLGLPPIDSLPAAMSWLAAERANVLACIDEFVTAERHSFVVGLATAMAPYLRRVGPWDEAADLYRVAADAARRSGDRSGEAQALANLGTVSRFMADYPKAQEALEQSLAAYREIGDQTGQAHTLNQLGIVWYMVAAYRRAAQAQTEALAICRETGDRLGQANALADLGMDLRLTGDLRASAEAQTEALDIYRQIGDRYGEANALRDLGIVNYLTSHYTTAETRQADALAIYEELADPAHQGYAWNEIGTVRRARGDRAGAAEAHQRALAKFEETGDRFGQANARRLLGVLDRLAGDHDAAAAAQTKALNMYLELGSRGGEAASLTELGVLRRLSGDLTEARDSLDQALALYRELGDRCAEAEILNQRGQLNLDANNFVGAREQFETALDLAQHLPVPIEEAHARRGLARCRARQGDFASAARDIERAIATYRWLGASEAEAAGVAELHSLDQDTAG